MSLPVNVVVYYRARPSEPDASAAAIAAQKHAVASWTLKHSASVVAEFTEAEHGEKARPQLGKALALCRRENARLLIARTNPIGSGEAFGSLYGNDISGVRCERLTQPVGIVVYLRTRPSEPTESDVSLRSQREAVTAWLAKRLTVLVGEYIEVEDDATEEHPALSAALATCQGEANGTTLLIGTCAAIGTGQAFLLPATKVPVEVAWMPLPNPGTSTPQDIAAPPGAAYAVSLLFEPAGGQHLSVYLCSSQAQTLYDVQVSSTGETTQGPSLPDGSSSLLSTSISRKELGTVPPGICRFVEHYDLFWDGDLVTSYQVAFRTADSLAHKFVAVVGTGGPHGRIVRLTPTHPVNIAAPASI